MHIYIYIFTHLRMRDAPAGECGINATTRIVWFEHDTRNRAYGSAQSSSDNAEQSIVQRSSSMNWEYSGSAASALCSGGYYTERLGHLNIAPNLDRQTTSLIEFSTEAVCPPNPIFNNMDWQPSFWRSIARVQVLWDAIGKVIINNRTGPASDIYVFGSPKLILFQGTSGFYGY